MVARALFLSSSFSIGSTAQQGRAVRLYSNLAYLTQTPRRGYKTQYTRSFHLRSDFFVGIGILSVTLKTPKLKCFCLVFLRYSEVRFKKKVTSGCRAQYLKKENLFSTVNTRHRTPTCRIHSCCRGRDPSRRSWWCGTCGTGTRSPRSCCTPRGWPAPWQSTGDTAATHPPPNRYTQLGKKVIRGAQSD